MPRYVPRREIGRTWGQDLYIMSAGPDLVKVGRSYHAERRLGEVQRGAPWMDIHLAAVFADRGAVETLAHAVLSDWGFRRVGGEWWACSLAQASAAVAEALSEIEAE